jgi:hypothetical protein
LRPVGIGPLETAWGPWIAAPIEGLAGTALGVVLGVASWPASSLGTPGRSGHLASVAACAVLGTFLGWQAAAGIAFLGSLAWSTGQLAGYLGRFTFRLPWMSCVVAMLLVWLLAWRHLVGLLPEFGRDGPWYLPPLAAVATLTVAWAGRTLADAARHARREAH